MNTVMSAGMNAATRAGVTVAVSTIDRPDSLVRCITAILDGQVLPAEIVIVDQGADSTTADVVLGKQWDRIVPLRYIQQHRRGLAASRNLALAYATQPIIAFTDDDCVPHPEWLAQIVAAFGGPEQPHAVTGRIEPLGPERPGFYAVSSRLSSCRSVYRGFALPWGIGSGGNTAVRRDWLRRIGGFDEALGASSPGKAAEDTDVLYRLLRAGATLQYEPSATVCHERQDRARRLASRPSYGFGMGAFCAKWARRGDAYAAWMLGCWLLERVRPLLASIVRARPQRIREELMMLHGAARGLAYGLSLVPVQRECPYDLSAGSSSSV
jgi:glycosyltransferase involved in cell wall biosynthesis